MRTERTERRQLRPRLNLHLHLRVLLPLFAPYRPPAKLRRRDTATAAAKKRAKGSGRRPKARTTTTMTTTGTTRSSRKRWPRRPACGWNKRRVLARRYTTQRGSFPSPSVKGYWRIAAFYYKYVFASTVLATFSHDGGVLRRAVHCCPVPLAGPNRAHRRLLQAHGHGDDVCVPTSHQRPGQRGSAGG